MYDYTFLIFFYDYPNHKNPACSYRSICYFFYTNSHCYCAYNILSYGSPPASPGPPKSLLRYFLLYTYRGVYRYYKVPIYSSDRCLSCEHFLPAFGMNACEKLLALVTAESWEGVLNKSTFLTLFDAGEPDFCGDLQFTFFATLETPGCGDFAELSCHFQPPVRES